MLATQNPLEMEGTYPLPEAQLDRFFFKLIVGYPTRTISTESSTSTTPAADPRARDGGERRHTASRSRGGAQELTDRQLRAGLRRARRCSATHPTPKGAPRMVRQYVTYGASPRGAQTLILAARRERYSIALQRLLRRRARGGDRYLRHRMKRNLTGEVAGVTTDDLVRAVLDTWWRSRPGSATAARTPSSDRSLGSSVWPRDPKWTGRVVLAKELAIGGPSRHVGGQVLAGDHRLQVVGQQQAVGADARS